jgi:hypothetical protein
MSFGSGLKILNCEITSETNFGEEARRGTMKVEGFRVRVRVRV